MMANGPLEIYGTVIGAKLYDSIFNILRSCGFAFWPLLGLFFHNITFTYETPFETGADTSLRRVSIQFIVLVFCIMLFAAPTHKLDITGIIYKPACSPSAEPSTFGDTGTTYDDAFSDFDYDDIRVPIGLAAVLDGSSGITNAAIVSLPCKTDVQEIQHTIDTTRLTPELATQIGRFNNECYASARAKFNAQNPDKSTWENTMNDYGGQTDLSWVGSHVLRQLYYNDIYPTSPVSGFPYGEFPYKYQDYNQKQGLKTPKWGFPSCEQWWSDSTYGLENQLVNLVNQHQPQNSHLGEQPVTDQLQVWLAKMKNYVHKGSQITPEDVIARGLLYDVGSESSFGNSYTGWMDDSLDNGLDKLRFSSAGLGNTSIGTVTQGVALAGQTIGAAGAMFNRAEIAQEIPIIQAVLMALCLAFGPIILILGGYRVNVVFSYYFILSSVITMTFIEKLIHYIELSLHASQSYSVYALNNYAVMYNVFTKLYFYGPLLYLMLMSICGITAGNSLESVFSKTVAGSGSKLAAGIATKVFKVAK